MSGIRGVFNVSVCRYDCMKTADGYSKNSMMNDVVKRCSIYRQVVHAVGSSIETHVSLVIKTERRVDVQVVVAHMSEVKNHDRYRRGSDEV